MKQYVLFAAMAIMVIGGCNKSGGGIQVSSMRLSPGLESEYEGVVEHESSLGTPGTRRDRYQLTIMNTVLEQKGRGYSIASLRRIRRETPNVPGTGPAIPEEEYHLVILPIRDDLTHGFPRPISSTTSPLLSNVDDWYFPPLPLNSIRPGSEWKWQETAGLPSMRIHDCQTRYRVNATETTGSFATQRIEEQLAEPLPFQPQSGPNKSEAKNVLTRFVQRYWVADREPYLIKFEKQVAKESVNPDSTKLTEGMKINFQLKKKENLSAPVLEDRRRHYDEIAGLQEIYLRNPMDFFAMNATQLEKRIKDAERVRKESDNGMIRSTATFVVVTLSQQLMQARRREKAMPRRG